jgi:hypothetical protein
MSGLLDSGADPALGVAAPRGYYRTIYQTRRHTTASWGQHFEVLDYVERGLNGHQDQVRILSGALRRLNR